MYDVDVWPDLISRVTDAVIDELTEWQARPLDAAFTGICPVYPVVFIDALMVKVRDGVVANRPVYLATGVRAAVGGQSHPGVAAIRLPQGLDGPDPGAAADRPGRRR